MLPIDLHHLIFYLCDIEQLVTGSQFLLVSLAVEFTEKARIMDTARINRALARLASEIVEENHGITDLVLVGIRRRGVPLATRIADKIEDLEGKRSEDTRLTS